VSNQISANTSANATGFCAAHVSLATITQTWCEPVGGFDVKAPQAARCPLLSVRTVPWHLGDWLDIAGFWAWIIGRARRHENLGFGLGFGLGAACCFTRRRGSFRFSPFCGLRRCGFGVSRRLFWRFDWA